MTWTKDDDKKLADLAAELAVLKARQADESKTMRNLLGCLFDTVCSAHDYSVSRLPDLILTYRYRVLEALHAAPIGDEPKDQCREHPPAEQVCQASASAEMNGRRHSLKCDMSPFASIWSGNKKSELRNNDRNFRCGDILILRESKDCRSATTYTGRSISVRITHMQGGYGLPTGMVILSFEVITRFTEDNG